MKSQTSLSKDTCINVQNLLSQLEQNLKLPLHLNEQILKTLKRYKQLKIKFKKQQKINEFKDQVLQNVINMFQTKQAKILNKLKALEEINLKYMQKYIQAKKKSSKSRNPNMSLILQSGSKSKINQSSEDQANLVNETQSFRTPQRLKNGNQRLQRQMSAKINDDSHDLSLIQLSQSIFNSPQWLDMIKLSQDQLALINKEDEENNQKSQENDPNNENQSFYDGQTFMKVLIKGIDSYCFDNYKLQQDKNQNQKSFYMVQIEELIKLKKSQIQENKSLKFNIRLNNDLIKLKELKENILDFEKQLNALRQKQNQEILSLKQEKSLKNKNNALEILGKKIQIENALQAEIESITSQRPQLEFQAQVYAKEGQKPQLITHLKFRSFKQKQRNIFKNLCQHLMSQLQNKNEAEFIDQLIETINKKISQSQSYMHEKLKSLENYVSQIQCRSQEQNKCIEAFKIQNEKISKNLSELETLKDKYNFFIAQMEKEKSSNSLIRIEGQPSKITLRLDEMISKNQHQKQKELLRQCLAKKDQIVAIQEKQIQISKNNLIKVQAKIKLYFEQNNIPFDLDSGKLNLEQLFENYSNTLLKNAYRKQAEQREQTIKAIQAKYQKIVQVQREEFQERIDQYKQQQQLLQRQRDSYKTSITTQQKQFVKMKQFLQKIGIKKGDLQMQNSKTQEILKNVLEMMFEYLMSNISYENLLIQIETTIQNIKVCLKYRQKEKQRQSKESPVIDYRFSGLSAVSNDYSFSKLNKESYCDYFNQQSELQEESEVISKMSSEDEVLPPSRPSYSTNNAHKRQTGLIDINQRATMAHQDESLLGYLNPVQIKTPRVQFEKNTVFFESGLHDEYIRTLQSNLGYLKNRIPEQTIQIERQVELDTKEMYIKYKQALKCLQEAQKINQDNQVKYQSFMKELKEEGVFQAQEKVQNKLFYMNKILKEQEQLIEQQRIEFETTIAKKVMESQETMNLLMKNLNKSMSASRVK